MGSIPVSVLVLVGMLTATILAQDDDPPTGSTQDPAVVSKFELGDGVEPAVPGVGDILGSLQAGPDWDDIFTAEGSLKDVYDELGNPGGNGVPDFLDTWGAFRARRDAVFIQDDISAGSLIDASTLDGSGQVLPGIVDGAYDLGNAYAYTTLNGNLDGTLDLLLYAGVERLSSAGTGYVTLEFNQSPFLVTEDSRVTGEKSVGDLLIVATTRISPARIARRPSAAGRSVSAVDSMAAARSPAVAPASTGLRSIGNRLRPAEPSPVAPSSQESRY